MSAEQDVVTIRRIVRWGTAAHRASRLREAAVDRLPPEGDARVQELERLRAVCSDPYARDAIDLMLCREDIVARRLRATRGDQ